MSVPGRLIPAALLIGGAVFVGCNQHDESSLGPSRPESNVIDQAAGVLDRAARCHYSDDPATRTRTVTDGCTNAGVRLPEGWSLEVQLWSRPSRLLARPVVTSLSSATAAFVTLASPDAAYLSSTIKIDISSLPEYSTHPSVSDGLQTVSFSSPMEKLQVPGSWATWSSPPESESETPPVLFTQNENSLTLRFSRPASIVGFELEPNAFDLFMFTADFFSGTELVGSVTRSVNQAGLFAARSDGVPINRVTVSAAGEPFGFSIAQLRYAGGGSWSTRAALPSARRAPAVTGLNGRLYAIGGSNSAAIPLNTVQAYDPATNAWSTKAPLPVARQNGNGAATLGSTIYVAGGSDATGMPTRTLYAYDATTNTWSTKANMPVTSGCGGSALINSKLYVLSGCTSSSTGKQVFAQLLHRYDPGTNLWTTLRPPPDVHFQPSVGALNGKLYVAGGNNGAGAQTGRLDVYDPATNTWSTKAAMPTARVASAGAFVGGKFYVLGGRNGTTSLSTVEAYDPVTDSWALRAAMPTARAAMGVGVISRIYAVGGRDSTSVLSTNQRYTP
jgi:N-acetylneuraminic acid mutarotase